MKHHSVYLGLGTNLGDRLEKLQEAIYHLQQIEGIQINSLSSVYETDPVGVVNQPEFYNMVVKISTTLAPLELLDKTLAIEKKMHRVRTIRWGPRTIDIDILLYDEQEWDHPNLQIPHPRMWERAFVLIPLLDVIDSKTKEKWSIPKRVASLSDADGVRKTPYSISL